MATFLILPPRELLEHVLTGFLARILPGVPAPNNLLALVLNQVVAEQPQTFVVLREDLPESGNLESDLSAAFGAEPGDRVIEIGPPRNGGPAVIREWQVTEPVSGVASAR
jgi:hypothetical protein